MKCARDSRHSAALCSMPNNTFFSRSTYRHQKCARVPLQDQRLSSGVLATDVSDCVIALCIAPMLHHVITKNITFPTAFACSPFLKRSLERSRRCLGSRWHRTRARVISANLCTAATNGAKAPLLSLARSIGARFCLFCTLGPARFTRD